MEASFYYLTSNLEFQHFLKLNTLQIPWVKDERSMYLSAEFFFFTIFYNPVREKDFIVSVFPRSNWEY